MTQVQVQASDKAFAAVLFDGSVVAWGDADYGGDSSAVQGQLKNVQEVHALQSAFSAKLVDGSVVTWGGVSNWGEGIAVATVVLCRSAIKSLSLLYARTGLSLPGVIDAFGATAVLCRIS